MSAATTQQLHILNRWTNGISGHCSLKSCVKTKQRSIGLKNIVLTTSYGLVLDFEIYEGHRTQLINFELDLGLGIVLELVGFAFW